jgi:hypothetical protein
MKASLLTLIIAAQFVAPPPQAPQRGQAPNPSNAPALLSAAECKCSIEVTVKRPNGEAISDVDVTVTMAPVAPRIQVGATGAPQIIQGPAAVGGTTPAELTSTTDASGRAVFRGHAEGTYTVVARREGYFGIANDTFPAQANARVPVGPATAQTAAGVAPVARGAVIPARQPVQQITLNLVQGSTIAGRILDGNRRPASAIQVGAYRVTYQLGHRALTQVGTAARSDDRGEYRLFWYPPGEYYIHTGAAVIAAIANGGATYPNFTYYPGTQDQRSAVSLVVGEGSAMSGIDITMPASSGVAISGTIVNTIPGGRAGPQGQINRSVSSVFLVPRNAPFFENPVLIPTIGGAALAARGGNVVNNNETQFEIRGVPAGTYDFYPVYNDGSPPAAGSLPSYYFARTPIEVGSENVTGVQSVIRPGTNLKGHVTIMGNTPAAAPNRPIQPLNIANIRLQFQPRENQPSLVRMGTVSSATIDADGAFNLFNLAEGQYSVIGTTALPADAYVSEMLLDSRNVSDDGIINIAGNSQVNLEVTISRGGGTIQGTVEDAKHNPVAAARVTLIPDAPRRGNLLLYKTALSTAMGAFTLNGVAPGSYKLFAWEQIIPTGAEQDSDFMREYDLLGTSVSVTAGLTQANIQITPIPAKH